MNYAPIALFVYNRPVHVRHTVEALLRNLGAESSDLIVFSDDARTPDILASVEVVRAYLRTIKGFRSITIHHRPCNFGLAKSVIDGVTRVLQEYDRLIVLEDDMETSPHFLGYMNEALERFSEDERVISIHGYVYPVQKPLPETFFLEGADCWGWATWRRGWRLFNQDGQALLDELKRRDLVHNFDFNGAYLYSKMLKSQIDGKNDSWAIRWYASAFLEGKLTLYPGRSLVRNIGNDNSGTHCGDNTIYDSDLSSTAISEFTSDIAPSSEGRAAFEAYFRSVQVGLRSRMWRGFKRFFASVPR